MMMMMMMIKYSILRMFHKLVELLTTLRNVGAMKMSRNATSLRGRTLNTHHLIALISIMNA